MEQHLTEIRRRIDHALEMWETGEGDREEVRRLMHSTWAGRHLAPKEKPLDPVLFGLPRTNLNELTEYQQKRIREYLGTAKNDQVFRLVRFYDALRQAEGHMTSGQLQRLNKLEATEKEISATLEEIALKRAIDARLTFDTILRAMPEDIQETLIQPAAQKRAEMALENKVLEPTIRRAIGPLLQKLVASTESLHALLKKTLRIHGLLRAGGRELGSTTPAELDKLEKEIERELDKLDKAKDLADLL